MFFDCDLSVGILKNCNSFLVPGDLETRLKCILFI